MGKPLTIFLSIAFIFWLIGGTRWYKQRYCDTPVATTTENFAPAIAAKDQINPILFYFPYAQSQPMLLRESVSSLKKTADYLNQNTDKKLIVNGLASPKEISINASNDIGLVRAESIKNILFDLGAPAASIEVASQQSDKLQFVNNHLINGVNFSIIDNPDIAFQPLNLYFSTQQTQYSESQELSDYFSKLKSYLTINPKAKVLITAHNSKYEKKSIGNKRLDFIKTQIQAKEISLKQIIFDNKGAQKPIIASSKDIKNQRLEIRLVKP